MAFMLLNYLLSNVGSPAQMPNVIFLLADDLGWNDVGWHNPDILSPNLDRLARDGVILDSAYVEPVCTPSRTALLTGKYSYTLGMQHGALNCDKPQGLPLSEVLLPQVLQALGYRTHAIGKWHLGFCKWEYTPTFRGFDTFQGYYLGGQDYYTKVAQKYNGYDYRLNNNVYRPERQHYSTVEFAKRAEYVIDYHSTVQEPYFLYLAFQSVHIPLQVPKRYEELYSHIKNSDRREFSAMVTAMDDAVGRIVGALERNGQINNTLIIFTSDNGGAPGQGGNNWPLRGGKSTLWEGGTRVPTFIWGNMLKKRGYVNNGLLHMTDWFPTILNAIGVNKSARRKTQLRMRDVLPELDGVDQWRMLSRGEQSSRDEFVYSVNEISGRAAIRWKQFKLIEGYPGHYWDRYPPVLADKGARRGLHTKKRRLMNAQGRNSNSTLLFDLERDPIELENLAERIPEIVSFLKKKLRRYRTKLTPAINPRKRVKADPKYWGGVWSPGWC